MSCQTQAQTLVAIVKNGKTADGESVKELKIKLDELKIKFDDLQVKFNIVQREYHNLKYGITTAAANFTTEKTRNDALLDQAAVGLL